MEDREVVIAMLQVISQLVAREEIMIHIATISQRYHINSPPLAASFSKLTALLDPAKADSTSKPIAPIRGDAAICKEMSRLNQGWKRWAMDSAASTAAAPLPTPETAPGVAGAAMAAARKPPPDTCAVQNLVEHQQKFMEEVDETASLLRFWARR
jgi:hypothetical protein